MPFVVEALAGKRQVGQQPLDHLPDVVRQQRVLAPRTREDVAVEPEQEEMVERAAPGLRDTEDLDAAAFAAERAPATFAKGPRQQQPQLLAAQRQRAGDLAPQLGERCRQRLRRVAIEAQLAEQAVQPLDLDRRRGLPRPGQQPVMDARRGQHALAQLVPGDPPRSGHLAPLAFVGRRLPLRR